MAALEVVATAIGCSRDGDEAAASAPAVTTTLGNSQAAVHENASKAVLRRQSDAVAGGDRPAYLAAWARDPAAQQLAAQTYTSLRRLGVARIEPRLRLETVTDGRRSWTAQVDVTWALEGLQKATATTLRYTFTAVGAEALISAIAAVPGERLPVWLLPGLQVRRGHRSLVASSHPWSADRVERLLSSALDSVGAVLPAWRGTLVAYVPATPGQFASLVGSRPGDYRGIAAVTTTVDGSHDASAATAIVVNPAVFGRLGSVGARVVIAHEATHVATRAAAASMPLWVVEGFADYVGIGSVDLPMRIAAKAALVAVRREGAPGQLPGDASFAVGSDGLEATYEQAWLATSLIAETFGRQHLVAFYRWTSAHPEDLDGAFEQVLHTSRAAFTEAWRDSLSRLAGDG